MNNLNNNFLSINSKMADLETKIRGMSQKKANLEITAQDIISDIRNTLLSVQINSAFKNITTSNDEKLESYFINGYTYTWDDEYNAYVLRIDGLCDINDIKNFMLSSQITNGESFIIEFNQLGIIAHNNTQYFSELYSDNKYGLRISNRGELPITRIFNISGQTYLEFEQYWAINPNGVEETTPGQSCLLCSIINSIPFNANDFVNNNAILNEVEARFQYVLSGVTGCQNSLKYASQGNNPLYEKMSNSNNGVKKYISSWKYDEQHEKIFDTSNNHGESVSDSSLILRLDGTGFNISSESEGNSIIKYSDGPHYVACIPDANGGYYIIDSNHSSNRNLINYYSNPYVTKDMLNRINTINKSFAIIDYCENASIMANINNNLTATSN